MATTDSTIRSSTTSISSNPLSPMSIRPSTSYRAQSQLYQNQVAQQQEAQRQADEQARLDQAKAEEEYKQEQDKLYQIQRQQQLDEASRMGWATYVGPGGYALGTNFSDINRPRGTIYLGGQGEYSNLYKPGTVLNVTRNTNSEVDYSQFQSKPTNISIAKQPFLEQPTRITTQQNQMDYSQFQSKPKPQYLETPNKSYMISMTPLKAEIPIDYYKTGFGIFKAQKQISEIEKYNQEGYKGLLSVAQLSLKGFGTKLSEISSDAFGVEALPTNIKAGEISNSDFKQSKSLLFKESVIPSTFPQIKLFMPSTYKSITGSEARALVNNINLQQEYISKGLTQSISKQQEAGIRFQQENIIYNMGLKGLEAEQSKINLNPKTLEDYNIAVSDSKRITNNYNTILNKSKDSYNKYQSIVNNQEKDLSKQYNINITTNNNLKSYQNPILDTKILSPYAIAQTGYQTKEGNLTYKNIVLASAYTTSEIGKTFLTSVALGGVGGFAKAGQLIKTVSEVSPLAKNVLLLGGVYLLGYGGVKSVYSGYQEGENIGHPVFEGVRSGIQYTGEILTGYKGAEFGTASYYKKLSNDIASGKYTSQLPSEKVGKPFNNNDGFYKTTQETKFITKLPLTEDVATSNLKIKSFYDIENKRAVSKLFGQTDIASLNENKVYPLLGKSIEQDNQIKTLLITETDKSILKQEFLTLRNNPLELIKVIYDAKTMQFPTFEIENLGKNDVLVYSTSKPFNIAEDTIKTNIFLERTKQLGLTEEFARGYKPFNRLSNQQLNKLTFESNSKNSLFGINLFEETNYKLPKASSISGIPYAISDIASDQRFYSVLQKELKGEKGFSFFSSESYIKTKNPFLSDIYSKDFELKPKDIYLVEKVNKNRNNVFFNKEQNKPINKLFKNTPSISNKIKPMLNAKDFEKITNRPSQLQLQESKEYIDYITSINEQSLGKLSIQRQVANIFESNLNRNKPLSSSLGTLQLPKSKLNSNFLFPTLSKQKSLSFNSLKPLSPQKILLNTKTTQNIKPFQQSYNIQNIKTITSPKSTQTQLQSQSLKQINILEITPLKPLKINIKTPNFNPINNIPIRGFGFSPNKKRGVGSEFEYPPRGRLKNRKYRYVADLESYFKGISKPINIPKASKRTYSYLDVRPLPKMKGLNSKTGSDLFGF